MTRRPHASARRYAAPQLTLRATAAAAHAACGGLRPAMLGALSALAIGGMPLGNAVAQNTTALSRALPNPCSLSNACTYKGAQVVDFTKGNIATITTNGQQMTVTQTTDTALMNWRSFDIAAGNTVNFNRTGDQSFVAINRIHDTQASHIDGNLLAPKGQIYLINPNGLMFGNKAVVDVAGLIASTLDISDARVTKGLLGDGVDKAAFALAGDNPLAAAAQVGIDAGAVIKAGNIYVFSPTVNNAGALQVTSGGQVVLAAGQKVFLAGSSDLSLRGLLVEVAQGGTVTHTGDIQTPRGNTTLVGMAVNQNGRISATSALNENGSIRLLAREVASDAASAPSLITGTPPAGMFLNAARTGAVTLGSGPGLGSGSGSVTQVLLDSSDTATAALTDATAAAARSTITIDGAQVVIGGTGPAGATLIQAHGGDVVVSARGAKSVNSVTAVADVENADATLTIGASAKIDVSGERNVQVDGNRNYVYIDRLTSNDLRDAPLQRDGYLRGQGVYVNVAQDQAFIDLSGRRAAVAGTQAERNATGGNVVLHAEGSVNVSKGAQFDLSGGTTVTSAATGRTSQLLTADGRVVDIMNAKANEQYVGFADRYTQTIDAPREGISLSTTYEAPRVTSLAQFSEGKNAGSLEIVAPRGSFAGTLRAGTTPGAGQRSNTPLGGEVRIGVVGNSSTDIDQQVLFSRANVLLTNDIDHVATAVPASQQDRLIAMDTGMLQAGGVSRLKVLSDGYVTVARGAALDMGPGGTISLQGNAVDVNASLTARGGSLTVAERPVGLDGSVARDNTSLVQPTERGRIRFGSGVALDVSGLFTNDLQVSPGSVPASPVVRNGGSITVSGPQVDVAGVTRFDVDAGASVNAVGQAIGGKAGALTISAADTTVGLTDVGQLVLGDNLTARISGFGFSAGGSLTIAAPSITVGAQTRDGAVRVDTASLDRGFENISLRAGNDLQVQAGTQVAPVARAYGVDTPLRALADGADLSAALSPQLAPPAQQRPVTLKLSANGANGTLGVEAGAVINAGVQGTVALNAGQSIDLEGQLIARGGNVSLTLGSPVLNNPVTFGVERLQRQAIQLGSQSVIDVSGVSRVQVDALGQRSGAVLDGGSVALAATSGTLAMAPGAQIRADGASDQIDLRGAGAATRVDVASRGGAVSLSAQQGLFVDGSLSAKSGGAGVEGGRLSVRFEGLSTNQQGALDLDPEINGALFAQDRVLTLDGAKTALPPAGGASSAATYAGHGRISSTLVNGSGFDTVQLTSTNVIEAPHNTALNTASSLTLDSQALRVGEGATLSLAAPTVTLGFLPRNASYLPNQNAAASGGGGTLQVAARQIELVGALALQGIGNTTLSAQDDVLLRGGTSTSLRPQGSLQTGGNLAISAAQLTPASMTDYSIALQGNPAEKLIINASGTAPLAPLSAAGSVVLTAPNIDIAGGVTAPQGSIVVTATDTVRLRPGAVLSVAGTLDVPLGTVFNGSQWVYADDPNTTANNIATNAGVTAALPEKRISVSGATVDVDPKARLDVSGGGNTVAQEFVAGPGGSIDIRQNFVPTAPGALTTQRNTLFALIPARGDHAAPFDPQIYSNLTQDAAVGGDALLRVGQTITIGAGSGIPAGTYTVMPVRYALLPGAYAVQPVTGYTDLQPGNSLTEAAGTVIVAGRLGIDGAGASTARWGGYRVYDGSQLRKLAELREYSGSAFTTAAAAAAGQVAPRTAWDAGAVSIAGDQLRLDIGSIRAAASGTSTGSVTMAGRGAEVALSAPHLIVTDQPTVAATAPGDTLVLNAQALSQLKSETLVLGAAASHGAGVTIERGTLTLDHVAQTVQVGGTQVLSAGEVLLTGSQQVSVGVGTAITADASQNPVTSVVNQSGDGASLLVSNAQTLPAWARSGSSGAAGDLQVAESALLSGRSVLFDASRQQRYAPSVILDASNIGLSAAHVNLGDVPSGASGLVLSNALLAQFGSADSFSITSGSSFDIYGSAHIGSASLKSLTLDGAGFVAHASGSSSKPSASATVIAGDVNLRNSAGSLPTAALSGGTGTLAIQAVGGNGMSGDIVLAGGDLAARGFAQTTLTATGQPGADAASSQSGTGQLLFKGKGSFASDGDVTLDAVRLAGGAGADQAVAASGVLRTVATSAPSQEVSQSLGARLSLTGQRVEHGGRIELPSGTVSLNATGSGASDDVTLLSGSTLNVAGSTQNFAGQTADASAGSVTLASQSGSVRSLAGSTLNIAGAGSNGDAGALHLNATLGTLQLDGSLLATPGSAARGADVSADVGNLPDLGTLARPLAAGSDAAQALTFDVRVRQGDVLLQAGDTVSAHSIRIAVDGAASGTRPHDGQLQLNGTLNVSGSRAGSVELSARDRIALGDGAAIKASSSGSGEEGGTVLLSARINEAVPATLDAITIAPTARIDVSGPAGSTAAALGGTLTLRAPMVATSTGRDVALTPWQQSSVVGARQTVVEATEVKSYSNDLTLDAGAAASTANPLPTWAADLQNFMKTEQASARLKSLGAGGFVVRPGLELRSTGNITVAKAIDFTSSSNGNFQWRYGGNTFAASQPGALTLRAAGSLTLNGGLQDGFVNAPSGNGSALLQPYAADSWRYQLTAGADLHGAAAAATQGSSGNVTLQPSGASTNAAIIRTGTGTIDIAAAHDIQLKGTNVAIYSGGQLAADANGYVTSNPVVQSFNPSFAEHGGSVTLEAGNDVVATVPSTQLINNWLWRAGRGTDGGDAGFDFSGTANAPTAWWVNAGTFAQGVGALGGGDLSVKAGHDVRSLTAAVPTNGYLTLDARGQAASVIQHNGGSLDVLAGNAIQGGAYYAERGALNLRADTLLKQSDADLVFVAQGSNTARLQARGDLDIFGSFNPLWASTINLFEQVVLNQNSPINSAFTSYAATSKLDARSLTGTASLSGSLSDSRLNAATTNLSIAKNTQRQAFFVLPGTMDLVAFGGDVAIASSKLMAPSANGQLRLLADGSVQGPGAVVMSDLDPASLPSVSTPQSNGAWRAQMQDLKGAGEDPNTHALTVSGEWGLTRPANHSQTLLHADDSAPAQVIARNGDVSTLRIEVPKPLVVEAAGDVRDTQLWAQNLSANSVTQVHAGGAITMSDNKPNITITGSGVAEVLAGGAINLGASDGGIVTRGNLVNSALPSGGASLIVAAGLGRDGQGFVQQPDYANVLREFVRYDAFASAGRDASALNAQVLSGLDFGSDKAKAEAGRALLTASLLDRSGASQNGSQFNAWLNQSLTTAERMKLALSLAQGVQAVANQRFVATANTESFAPGYLSFHDLFPGLTSNAAGLRQFVTANPFSGATDADTLRREALKGLPEALRSLLLQALDNPAQVTDPGSAFNQGLAELDPGVLAAGSRQLVAQVQAVAGSTLDALRVAGRVDTKVGTPFAKGLDDLARAFSPAGPVASRDITLVFSQIKAEQSGNVALLAPRGGVIAGQANPPAGVASDKQAYQLGVLTLGGGDIVGMVRDNFDVYRSRVFTVAGGDIHLWASLGNIDAGRGPRDTVVAPPPRLSVDTTTGLVTLDVSTSVSGSGIGALKTSDDQVPSNIRLIAPNGFIDAGEAGIRAETGTVTLGTNIVLNAGNINAGGGVSGGAVVVAPPAPLPQSTSAGQADKAVEQTQKALSDQQRDADERAKKERRKRVTGEFIGFGDD